MKFGLAGVPMDATQARDYRAIFATMAEAGLTVYFPTSQYQELPVPLGFGTETDVLPPPFGSAGPDFYAAAREYGIKIAISADLLYPQGEPFPTGAADPLRALAQAAGADLIHGVFGYDEPALNGVDPAVSQALYAHIKSVDPSLQVVQVHAAIPEGFDAAAYLQAVLAHAAHSDVVGFDVYPIMPVPGARTPGSGDALRPPAEALAEYVDWLQAQFPDKQHLMVLQGFGLADLYSDAALAQFDPALVEMARAPTPAEMAAMLAAVAEADEVWWWGQSHLETSADPTWAALLAATAAAVAAEVEAVAPPPAPPPPVDLDAAPDALAEAAAEGAATGVAFDPDAAAGLVVDDARFTLAADGRLVRSGVGTLDHETAPSVTLQVARAGGPALTVTLTVTDSVETLRGGAGADALVAGAGRDSIIAGGGDDMVDAGGEADTVDAGAGADMVAGGDGADRLLGRYGADLLDGGEGDDQLVGALGDDVLVGGAGRDTLDGGAGRDVLDGGAGADRLSGGLEADYLDGGADGDVLDGGGGDDVLVGGPGTDTLTGGVGADLFVFAAGDGAAQVQDFAPGVDLLHLIGAASFAGVAVADGAEGATVAWGDVSITLVGLDAGGVTADLFLFA